MTKFETKIYQSYTLAHSIGNVNQIIDAIEKSNVKNELTLEAIYSLKIAYFHLCKANKLIGKVHID